MSKKKHLAIFLLAVCGLATVFSLTVSAQSPLLQDTNTDKIVIQNYMSALSMPTDQRRNSFVNLGNIDKANIMRFHLAFQLLKRPWLNQQQKDLILETMSTTSPQMYDTTNPQITALNQQNAQNLQQRILNLFQKQEGFEIFGGLSGDPRDNIILEQYRNVTVSPYTEQRRAIFKNLSAADKSDIMKVHLLYHLSRSDMNTEQRKFISVSMNLVSPEAYNLKVGTFERSNFEASVKQLASQIPKLFKQKDAVQIFLNLGGINDSLQQKALLKKELEENLNFVKINYSKNLNFSYSNDLTNKSRTYLPACGCNAYNDLCSWDVAKTRCQFSSSSNPSCSYGSWGCGPLWAFECNGLCVKTNGDEFENGEF